MKDPRHDDKEMREMLEKFDIELLEAKAQALRNPKKKKLEINRLALAIKIGHQP